MIVKERIVYLDVLRVLSICAVVLLHVTCNGIFTYPVDSFNWIACNAANSLTRWSVPVFVMISGALMLNREYSVSALWRKKVLHIIVVFVVWSVLYALATVRTGAGDVLKAVVAGHYHLWFLLMIAGVYAMQPFMKRIVESTELCKYFLSLFVVVAVVLPHLESLIPIGPFTSGFTAPMKLVIGFCGYFVLGFQMHRMDLSKYTGVACILTVISFAACAYLTYVTNLGRGELDFTFYENFSIMTFVESVSVFVIVKNIYGGVATSRWVRLAPYVLGVYLVHAFVLYRIELFGSFDLNPLLWMPCRWVVTLLLSFVASFIIAKIRFFHKILL